MNTDEVNHIYRDGRHYDCLFGDPCDSFWIETAKQAGNSVLELGCGTGKISIPIAEAGFDVVGIDSSENMLAYGKEKAGGKDIELRLIHSDMREFSLGEKFDLIILPSNNLCHLLNLSAVESCFRNVADHLAGNGMFVIDVFVPDLALLCQKSEQESIMAEYEDPDGRGQVVVTSTSIYEPDTQIKRSLTRQRVSGCSEIVGHLNMKMYFPQELEALLHYNGFAIEARYGGYAKEPFSAQSRKQIIVAKKESVTPQLE